MFSFKSNLLFIILASFLLLSSCIGTVEDLEEVNKSKEVDSVKISFDGVFDCYAISQDKIEVRFNTASVLKGTVKSSDLVYQAFLNGNFNTPVASNKLQNLRQDASGYYHLTVPSLDRNTAYSIFVKALDPSSNTIDSNIASCSVSTLDEEYPLFDGLQTAAPTAGLAGQNEITLKWNTAEPAKYILGSIAADGYKIYKYNIYWSQTSGELENMSLLTEILEDNDNPITTYKVTGLNPGATYHFLVRAQDESDREEKNIKVLSSRTNLPSIVSFNGISTLTVPTNKSGYTSLSATWSKAKGDFNRYRIFAIPKSSAAYSSSTINPNSTVYLKADITDVEAVSALIPGLNQEEDYAIFVVACMYDTNTSSCVTYDGEDVKLSKKTLPPLAPYAGVGSVAKLEGSAGLSSVKLIWNPPAVSQGVCDDIKLFFVNSSNVESTMYACNDPLVDPTMPCFSSSPACEDSEIILSSVSLDTEFCFRAKVYENGRYQETTNKKCFTNTIQKPVFQSPPKCTALDGGTELQIDWNPPTSGDYSNFVLFVQQVADSDTSTLNSNQWMSDAIDFYEGGSGSFTAELLDKAIATKKLKYRVPDTKYRIGIKTLISTGGNNYYDENANVIECRTKPLSMNFTGWRHVTSVGPRINGIADQKSAPTTVFLPKSGYAAEELNFNKRGVVTEYATVKNGRIIPRVVANKIELNIYNNYWTFELVDKTQVVDIKYEYDNSLPSPYHSISLAGNTLTIKTRSGNYTNNYCSTIAAEIAADSGINSLVKLNCYSSGSGYLNYAYGSFPIKLDGPKLSGGDSGFVAVAWDEFETSAGEKLTDFIFNNQIAETDDDGYYIYRKETAIANNKTDLNNLINNIQGSNSGWVELNTGAPIKNSDDLVFVDQLANGTHPIHSTNALRSFREKADTGKVVWYTVRYKLAGKLMNISQDGTNTDVILQVLIPPANMASIHPWIANMQMCKQMGKDYDRVNDYRCEFGGLGSTKIDNQYYYDVGGFVVVDRFALGCNVTFDGDLDEDTGMTKYCSQYPATDGQSLTEAPDQSCYLRSSSYRPNATPKAVAYQFDSGLCLVNQDNGSGDSEYSNWKTIAQVSGDTPSTTTLPAPISAEALGRVYASGEGYGEIMSTNDSNMPPLLNVNFMQAHYMCQSHTIQVQNSSLYSAKIRKRQLSAREFQHASMPSILDTVERPNVEYETAGHGDTNNYINALIANTSNGSGDCNTDQRTYFYNSPDYSNGYVRVLSGKITYYYGSSYTKAHYNTGSYNLSGSSLRSGGTENCVSGFGIQDYVGFNHFLNDQALCKKYSDNSNAECTVYPDQTWLDSYTGFFPLTKFIEDNYADREIYKNAFGQKFFWKFFDDGVGQFGYPRAQNTKYTYSSYQYPGGNTAFTHIWSQMSALEAFSFVLGQPLKCLNGESYCHPDDKGSFVTRSAASDYGTEFLNLLSQDFEMFFPIEYNTTLSSAPSYFERVLTRETFANYYTSGSGTFTFDDGSGGAVNFYAGNEKRNNHRFSTHWEYDKTYSNRSIGVRCGVKVNLELNGGLKGVDDENLN